VETISETCNKTKKLSRYIRNLWEGEVVRTEIPHNIRKYSDNTEMLINLEDSIILNGLWGYSFWDNSTKTFIFKLHNNTLGYNYTVTKHAANMDKDCTFCRLNRIGEESTETPLHLFFTCPSTEIIVEVGDNIISRQDFFGVPKRENKEDTKLLLVLNILIKKYLWECKQRFTLPSTELLKKYIIRNLNVFSCLNNKFRNTIAKSSFYFTLAAYLG
jgi:hypothetical protein